MNVSLTPELEAFVQREVASGRYATSSEVLREALRLLQHQRAVLKAEIHRGLSSPTVPADDVSVRSIKKRAARRQ